MYWLDFVSYFFGGAFLANAIPHIVSGIAGRAFQSPFATPPGEGLSSAPINILWGFFNLAVAYLLIIQVGAFDLRFVPDVLAAGLGALAIALVNAHHFGQFHGGNLSAAQPSPQRSHSIFANHP